MHSSTKVFTSNSKRSEKAFLDTGESGDLEIDVLDLIAFLWRIRKFLSSGLILGILLGTFLIFNQLRDRQVATSAFNSEKNFLRKTAESFNYKSSFLIDVKDVLPRSSSEQQVDLKNFLQQEKVLYIFLEQLIKASVDLNFWLASPYLRSMRWSDSWEKEFPRDQNLFEEFMTKQSEENILSFASYPSGSQVVLNVDLPIEIEKNQLNAIIEATVSQWNSIFIEKEFQDFMIKNQQIETEIMQLRNEYSYLRSNLYKIYFSLSKRIRFERPNLVSMVFGSKDSSIQSFTMENTLRLVDILAAEKLIDAEHEESLHSSLLKTQEKMMGVEKRMNTLDASIKKQKISEIRLVPEISQRGLARNVASPRLLGQKMLQNNGDQEVKASPKHWSILLTFGAVIGVFLSFIIGGSFVYIKANWRRIQDLTLKS